MLKQRKYLSLLKARIYTPHHDFKKRFFSQSLNYYRSNGYKFAKISPFYYFYRQNPQFPSRQRNFVFQVQQSIPDFQISHQARTKLQTLYLGNISPQFSHIQCQQEKQWLYKTYDSIVSQPLTKGQSAHAFTHSLRAELFDQYLATKFTSFKRYSLEGNQALLVAINTILASASQKSQSISNVILGMPHRGRLNTLVCLLQYPMSLIFRKIATGQSDIPEPQNVCAIDDVISHVGCSNTRKYYHQLGRAQEYRDITVSLIHNPSHLEAQNPVSMGKALAKAKVTNDQSNQVLNVQIHGDAAFAGQGIVYETLQLSRLQDFTINGSIHIIGNNFIGFTTLPHQGRSTRHSGDICKAFGIPVIHVNGSAQNQIDSVFKAAKIAYQYQKKYKKDILIDLHGYRKYGHNQVDEPQFTQPLHYRYLKSRGSSIQSVKKAMIQNKILRSKQVQTIEKKFTQHMQDEFNNQKQYDQFEIDEIMKQSYKGNRTLTNQWKGMQLPRKDLSKQQPYQTGVNIVQLIQIGQKSVEVPQNFEVHSRLKRAHIQARLKQLKNKKIDWSTAEALAFGKLLKEGYFIRISGEDSQRGTFSQRHVTLTDSKQAGKVYSPFGDGQYFKGMNMGKFQAVNSHLSQAAVLAYQYGYSLQSPKILSIWQAQFGDFGNTAQVIIDQFISSGEAKWMRQSGIVMLLPHGYDGAGPQHSNCRIQRFLQMVHCQEQSQSYQRTCRLSNMQVMNLTTPSNYFHALRRQMKRKYRKPLVIAAPKKGLRMTQAMSDLSELGQESKFQPIIVNDYSKSKSNGDGTLIFCSGRFFYDIEKIISKVKDSQKSLRVVRIQQIAPFPSRIIKQQFRGHKFKKIIWAQEESLNTGAYQFCKDKIQQIFPENSVEYIGRKSHAASCIAYGVGHKRETQELQDRLQQTIKV